MVMSLRERECALVSGRWGDSARVLEHAVEWYGHAGVDAARVRGQLLHPIAHYSALLHHENDVDTLLSDAAISADDTAHGPQPDPRNWILGANPADKLLRDILTERLIDSAIVETTEAQQRQATAAVALLQQTVPQLSTDVLSHVCRYVITDDRGRVGETMRDLPTVLIFGPVIFNDLKMLAESFLHEALHTKTIISERSANIIKEDRYERDDVLPIPWRRDDHGAKAKWSVSRSFLAFYVYAHLTVLWAAFWERDHSGRDLDQFRRVCFRAAYLSNLLRTHPKAVGLGPARSDMMAWLDRLRIPPFDLTERAMKLVEYRT